MQIHPTVNVEELRKGIESDLAQIAAPLLTRLQNVDALIAERLDDLANLRKARLTIVHAVRPLVGEDAIPLEPGRNAKAGPKPKPKAQVSGVRGTHTRVSQERVDAALAWARAQSNGNGFTSREMREGMSAEGDEVSRSSGEAVVRILRERELIRVVSPHRGPTHPARYGVVS